MVNTDLNYVNSRLSIIYSTKCQKSVESAYPISKSQMFRLKIASFVYTRAKNTDSLFISINDTEKQQNPHI